MVSDAFEIRWIGYNHVFTHEWTHGMSVQVSHPCLLLSQHQQLPPPPFPCWPSTQGIKGVPSYGLSGDLGWELTQTIP
jgi:hypothetical protein